MLILVFDQVQSIDIFIPIYTLCLAEVRVYFLFHHIWMPQI